MAVKETFLVVCFKVTGSLEGVQDARQYTFTRENISEALKIWSRHIGCKLEGEVFECTLAWNGQKPQAGFSLEGTLSIATDEIVQQDLLRKMSDYLAEYLGIGEVRILHNGKLHVFQYEVPSIDTSPKPLPTGDCGGE